MDTSGLLKILTPLGITSVGPGTITVTGQASPSEEMEKDFTELAKKNILPWKEEPDEAPESNNE